MFAIGVLGGFFVTRSGRVLVALGVFAIAMFLIAGLATAAALVRPPVIMKMDSVGVRFGTRRRGLIRWDSLERVVVRHFRRKVVRAIAGIPDTSLRFVRKEGRVRVLPMYVDERTTVEGIRRHHPQTAVTEEDA